jgi:DNA-binding HxlR family transcriptional regulator
LATPWTDSRAFDEFQKSLNIAPNMLARRLSDLVDAGLLRRRRYSERPPRYEYVLTERGRDFRPVIVAMFAWGNKHFAPEGASVLLVDKKSGRAADPVLVDRRSGRPLNERDFVFAAGPAASARAHAVDTRSSLRSSHRERCTASAEESKEHHDYRARRQAVIAAPSAEADAAPSLSANVDSRTRALCRGVVWSGFGA